jgi:hypothetical protein
MANSFRGKSMKTQNCSHCSTAVEIPGATHLPVVVLLGAANVPIVAPKPVDLQNRGQETS